jgi:tetratricopeptide (TPR) repeat protein
MNWSAWPNKHASFVFVLLALLVSACATPQLERLQSDRQGLPERAEVPAVPFFAQEDLYCGPAALATTLAWSGLAVTQQELVPVVYTPGREGTLQSDILAGARSYGRLAVPVNALGALLGEIAAGHPVLVFQNLGLSWLPQWHYAVALGYDLSDGTLTLNSGRNERTALSLATFERTWARAGHWALVITPPDRLPASAGEQAVIEAAAGLERARRRPEAATAYAAIVARWPEAYIAWMGLGNAGFAAKEFAAAEAAYARAGALRPDAPEPWNNLAYAVARQGRTREAVQFAERAVANASRTSSSSERAKAFQESLVEIQLMDRETRNRR